MNYKTAKLISGRIALLQVGFKVYRVEDDVEELKTDFFAYARNDGLHRLGTSLHSLVLCIPILTSFSSFAHPTDVSLKRLPGKTAGKPTCGCGCHPESTASYPAPSSPSKRGTSSSGCTSSGTRSRPGQTGRPGASRRSNRASFTPILIN